MEDESAGFSLPSEGALLYSLKGKRTVEMHPSVLVFGGGVSQYKPVEGFCFYVVVVVLARIFCLLARMRN